MKKIYFYSTNRKAPEVDLAEALFTGQAPDKGLYMPKTIPTLNRDEIRNLRHKTYPQIAECILQKYVSGTLSNALLHNLCEDAYTYDVPLEAVSGKRYVMRLDRGPTASFKDFAARMMARLFGVLMQDQERELIILTATSGDTGSAIAHAFFNIPNIKVMVLFPPTEVSTLQRRQMTTLGNNVTTVAVDGKFDDCQALVKQAFADKNLQKIRLTSANSINIGRLLPQTIYYFFAYARLAENNESILFSIPSGNFGNMMGALLAWRMGLPIQRLIIATNANDEVPSFLKTGKYEKIDPSRKCISNAMNVGHPSNFARVVDLYGGWLDETGAMHRQPDIVRMRQELWTVSISDDDTKGSIKSAWEKHQLLLEPHGAVGWAGLLRYMQEEDAEGLIVSVETAHPAKFPEEIQTLLSFTPEIPDTLTGLEKKKEHYLHLPRDYNAFRDLLLKRYGG